MGRKYNSDMFVEKENAFTNFTTKVNSIDFATKMYDFHQVRAATQTLRKNTRIETQGCDGVDGDS